MPYCSACGVRLHGNYSQPYINGGYYQLCDNCNKQYNNLSSIEFQESAFSYFNKLHDSGTIEKDLMNSIKTNIQSAINAKEQNEREEKVNAVMVNTGYSFDGYSIENYLNP